MAKKQNDHAGYDSVALKVGRRGPDKLLASFSKTHFPLWVALSLCVHLGLAGFISYGYIRDNYIDPAGAAERQRLADEAEAAAKKASAPAAAPGAKSSTPGAVPGGAAKPQAASAAPGAKTPDGTPDARKNAPVMKRITDSAKPGEIPTQPGDLGISIDDTDSK